MKKLGFALFAVLLPGLAAPAAWASPILFEGKFNQDGAVGALGSAPANWNLAAFDIGTGLGTITASITGAGDHNILVFLDLEIDEVINTFFNEFGSPGGPAPGPGFGWEIDEPGFVFGDIYDNFLAGALDGLNGVPAGSPDDVSFALGRNFSLGPDEVATLNFRTSLVAPVGVPHLIHTDPHPASDLSVYFSSDLTIRGGGEPPIPEPRTVILLLSGLGVLVAARFRKSA